MLITPIVKHNINRLNNHWKIIAISLMEKKEKLIFLLLLGKPENV